MTNENDTQNIKGFHVLIEGRVTGVGFRFSAINEAQRHGDIRGYIRNKDHRTVETVIEGNGEAVKSFLNWLKKGPPSASVANTQVTEIRPTHKYKTYEVAH